MIKSALFFLYLLLWSVVIWLHWIIVDVFPYPYNNINLTILFSLILIIILGNSKVMWWFFVPFLLEELFTATPYGLNILAIFSALAFFNWCLQSVFVSRSLLIIWLMALATIVGYRLILYLLLFFTGSVNLEFFTFSWQNIGLNLFWELVLTGIALVVSYLPMMIFVKKFRPEYVMVRRKEYGSKKYFY